MRVADVQKVPVVPFVLLVESESQALELLLRETLQRLHVDPTAPDEVASFLRPSAIIASPAASVARRRARRPL